MLTIHGMITGGIFLIFLLLIVLFRKKVLLKINANGIIANSIYFIVMVGFAVPISMSIHHFLMTQKIQIIPHEVNQNELKKSITSYMKAKGEIGTINISVSYPRTITKNEEFYVIVKQTIKDEKIKKLGISFNAIELDNYQIKLQKTKEEVLSYFPEPRDYTYSKFILKL